MSLFQLKWLRRLIRRKTRPIPLDIANVWRKRLSLGYMVIAWQAFGVVCYMIYTGRNDWAQYYGYKSDMEAQLSPGQQFAGMMNIEKGKIIRFSGFQKVGEADIDKNENNENIKK